MAVWRRSPPRPRPLFVLRGVVWAPALLRNPERSRYDDHLELQITKLRSCLVYRLRYERVRTVELVEGRHFTDVVFVTDGGAELVAPGIRNRALAPAKPYLAGVARRPIPALQA